MRSIPRIGMLGVMLFGAVAGVAQAQGAGPPSVLASPDSLERDLAAYANPNADKICWLRGEAMTVDWVASRDSGFRRDIFSRYSLEQIDGGWRWYRRDGADGNNLRATTPARPEGLTESEIEVHHGVGGARGDATFTVSGPLTRGEIRFDWTLPPERVCMSDGLTLEATVDVSDGDPGSQGIVFVVPLSQEQRDVQGVEVKACSPRNSTAVDSALGINHDVGGCRRELHHLQEASEWAVWVSLPESFYVVYPYSPDRRERR